MHLMLDKALNERNTFIIKRERNFKLNNALSHMHIIMSTV
jgi:hypothetical protein